MMLKFTYLTTNFHLKIYTLSFLVSISLLETFLAPIIDITNILFLLDRNDGQYAGQYGYAEWHDGNAEWYGHADDHDRNIRLPETHRPGLQLIRKLRQIIGKMDFMDINRGPINLFVA